MPRSRRGVQIGNTTDEFRVSLDLFHPGPDYALQSRPGYFQSDPCFGVTGSCDAHA
jgi:hypothetical protein